MYLTQSVRARQKESLYFWLYSYALVLLTGFGGGILANLFLGQPSLLLTNSLLVPLSALAWFLTHHVSGMQDFFSSVPVKLVCLCVCLCMNVVCIYECI